MKAATVLMACAIAVSFTAVADAKSRKKKVYRNSDAYASETYRPYTRPYSISDNGLCQRDTGTATSDLNFRNRCDVEEFWKRMEENGGGRR
ncbi:MAG: hypothetical protein AB7O43_02175 [Hyphomicrobiaceae bacterium]